MTKKPYVACDEIIFDYENQHSQIKPSELLKNMRETGDVVYLEGRSLEEVATEACEFAKKNRISNVFAMFYDDKYAYNMSIDTDFIETGLINNLIVNDIDDEDSDFGIINLLEFNIRTDDIETEIKKEVVACI